MAQYTQMQLMLPCYLRLAATIASTISSGCKAPAAKVGTSLTETVIKDYCTIGTASISFHSSNSASLELTKNL